MGGEMGATGARLEKTAHCNQPISSPLAWNKSVLGNFSMHMEGEND